MMRDHGSQKLLVFGIVIPIQISLSRFDSNEGADRPELPK